jgi:hypothetical protein
MHPVAAPVPVAYRVSCVHCKASKYRCDLSDGSYPCSRSVAGLWPLLDAIMTWMKGEERGETGGGLWRWLGGGTMPLKLCLTSRLFAAGVYFIIKTPVDRIPT